MPFFTQTTDYRPTPVSGTMCPTLKPFSSYIRVASKEVNLRSRPPYTNLLTSDLRSLLHQDVSYKKTLESRR